MTGKLIRYWVLIYVLLFSHLFNDLRSSAIFKNLLVIGFVLIHTINLPFIQTNLISILVLVSRSDVQRNACLSGSIEINYILIWVKEFELPVHRGNLIYLKSYIYSNISIVKKPKNVVKCMDATQNFHFIPFHLQSLKEK